MDKILQMIGMAKRAGKIVTGEFLCEKAIKSHESKLIIIATDISDSGEKSITDACKYYNVNYLKYADKEQLGKYTGGGVRAVISVNDRRFSTVIREKYSALE